MAVGRSSDGQQSVSWLCECVYVCVARAVAEDGVLVQHVIG